MLTRSPATMPWLVGADRDGRLAGQDAGTRLDRRTERRARHRRARAPARTARSASSSCAVGAPQTAMTASPMNFSTVPPYRPMTSRGDLEVAGQSVSRTSSASRSSANGVKPTRSANRTDTSRRSAMGAASCSGRTATGGRDSRGPPPAGLRIRRRTSPLAGSRPQLGQPAARRDAHSMQNFATRLILGAAVRADHLPRDSRTYLGQEGSAPSRTNGGRPWPDASAHRARPIATRRPRTGTDSA